MRRGGADSALVCPFACPTQRSDHPSLRATRARMKNRRRKERAHATSRLWRFFSSSPFMLSDECTAPVTSQRRTSLQSGRSYSTTWCTLLSFVIAVASWLVCFISAAAWKCLSTFSSLRNDAFELCQLASIARRARNRRRHGVLAPCAAITGSSADSSSNSFAYALFHTGPSLSFECHALQLD